MATDGLEHMTQMSDCTSSQGLAPNLMFPFVTVANLNYYERLFCYSTKYKT